MKKATVVAFAWSWTVHRLARGAGAGQGGADWIGRGGL